MPHHCCCTCRVSVGACQDTYPDGQGGFASTPIRLEMWQGSDATGTKVADQADLRSIDLLATTTYFYRLTTTPKRCDGSPAASCVREGTVTTPSVCRPFLLQILDPCRRRLLVTVFNRCNQTSFIGTPGGSLYCYFGGLEGATVTLTGDLTGTATTDAHGVACFDVPAGTPDSPTFTITASRPGFTTLTFTTGTLGPVICGTGTLQWTLLQASSCEGYSVSCVLTPDAGHLCDCNATCVELAPATFHGSDKNNGDFTVSNQGGNVWLGSYSYFESEAGHLVELRNQLGGFSGYCGPKHIPGNVTIGYELSERCVTEGGAIHRYFDVTPLVPQMLQWIGSYCSMPMDRSQNRIITDAPDPDGAPACDGNMPDVFPGTNCYTTIASQPTATLGPFACGEPISGTVTFSWGPEAPPEAPPSLTISP